MALIRASDYNTIQSTIASILGTGSGDFGYGQTVTSYQVATGNQITAQHWLNLRTDLLKARQHQTGANESGNIPLPAAGTPITGAMLTACSAMASAATTNRLVTPPSGQASLETLVSVSRTSAWNGTLNQVVTVTWPSDDAARAFFNTGSNIQFFGDRSGGNGGSKNITWSAMLSGMGTIVFGYSSTSPTGSGNGSGIGWSNLSGSSTQIFQKPAPAGAYSANDYYIYARKVANNQLEFTISFQDNAGPNPNYDEDIDGTLTSTVLVYRASGANVSVPLPPATTSGI